MGVYRFEDLRVWQAAQDLADRVGELIKRPAFRADLELSCQLNDAALSVANNIAEGFLRRRNKEMLQFLRIASASNGEVRSLFFSASGRQHINKEEFADLVERTNSVGRMLRRWQETLPAWPAPGTNATSTPKRATTNRTRDDEPANQGDERTRDSDQGRTKD